MKPVFLLAALLAMPMTACHPSHSDEADTPETAVDANETALDNDVGKTCQKNSPALSPFSLRTAWKAARM